MHMTLICMYVCMYVCLTIKDRHNVPLPTSGMLELICIYAYVCISVCIYVYLCISVCIYVYLCISVCMY
jgi:hypothetical protein